MTRKSFIHPPLRRWSKGAQNCKFSSMSIIVAAPDLVVRSKNIATIADEHADWGDKECRLAEPVVEALHREGLFGMWVPRSIRGGAELDPVSSLQVLENVSYG